MSHHHHDHDHDHGHHGHHHHDESGERGFGEKLNKRLDHWIRHSEEHGESYREWAGKARTHGEPAVGDLLEEIARLNDAITQKFQEAAGKLGGV